MRIRHLFLSAGHNFFGHHGRPPGEHPMIETDRLECVAGRGIRGDRFFDYKPDYKGQITFFSWEVLDAMARELHGAVRDPAAPRRNVIIENADLQQLIDREFELQGVRFLGIEECRPCYWMNQAIHPEAESWLKGRGGLRARILTSGPLVIDSSAP